MVMTAVQDSWLRAPWSRCPGQAPRDDFCCSCIQSSAGFSAILDSSNMVRNASLVLIREAKLQPEYIERGLQR
jgi:hypothetical protein